jgi:glycosyltransferase involved in cell wall biosynthesis
MLSIIVPAKNEEKFLPFLFKSLKLQSFQDFEVIVADANSSDKTKSISKNFGAKVVDGGLPGVGRNRGAKVAKGDLLLFLDSDVVLPPDFLEKNVSLFKKRDLDIATTTLRPLSSRFDDRIIHAAWNAGYKVIKNVKPACCGFHIFVRKGLFNASKGFDERVVWAEDAEFVSRVCGYGARFDILPVPVFVSVRRLEKEGRVKFLSKSLYGVAVTLLKGPIKREIFEYEWAGY